MKITLLRIFICVCAFFAAYGHDALVMAQGAVISAKEQKDIQAGKIGSAFFDSENLPVKKAEPVEGNTAAEVVDPVKDSAQRFVVVGEDADDKSFDARLTSARRAMDLGRYKAALRIFRQLVQEEPKNTNVLLGLASTFQKSGDVDRAIAVYDRLLEIEPKNTDAHVNMLGLVGQRYPAVALQRLKQLEESLDEFNPAVTGQVAFVLAQLGQYENALDRYAHLASREPENAQHILNMAIVSDQAGQKALAVKYYEEALQIDTINNANSPSFDRDQVFDRLAKLR